MVELCRQSSYMVDHLGRFVQSLDRDESFGQVGEYGEYARVVDPLLLYALPDA